jgi:hypothetical protein
MQSRGATQGSCQRAGTCITVLVFRATRGLRLTKESERADFLLFRFWSVVRVCLAGSTNSLLTASPTSGRATAHTISALNPRNQPPPEFRLPSYYE